MAEYLIRTDKVEKKTFIIRLDDIRSEKISEDISKNIKESNDSSNDSSSTSSSNNTSPKYQANKISNVIGVIYTDFITYTSKKDITLEEIINPGTKKAIAQISLFKDDNMINVFGKKEILSSISKNKVYLENNKVISYAQLEKKQLLKMPEYSNLEKLGIECVYLPNRDSNISKVLCYERDGNLSGIITTKLADDNSALAGLSLVLAHRIENQEYIFEFMKK